MSWKDYKPENPNNPYDTIGLDHNETLDFVVTGILSLPIGLGRPEAIYLQQAKLISNHLYLKSKVNDLGLFEDILNASYVALGRILSKRDSYSMISSKSSHELFDYYTKLLLILPYTTVVNVENRIEDIKALEVSIGADLVGDEKRIAYWISSVGRYSLAYWINEVQQEKSTWFSTAIKLGDFGEIPAVPKNGPPTWVTDDIGGALLAAFTTANPFVALGWGAATSAYSALADYYK